MAFENASHIDELVASSPTTTDDPFGANAIYLELQQLKTVLTTDFANVSGAVTASDVEMNYLDITTLGTAETSKALTISATDTWNVAGMTCSNLGTITTVDINGGTWQGTIDGAWTAAGQTCADLGTVTTCDINGGTLDGVTISGSTINGAVGGGTPAAGVFTTLEATTSLELASGATVTAILDEDAMGSDSATALATQQSIKAYVDNAAYATEAYADARGFYVISAVIEDISTLQTVYVPMSMAGTVTRVDTVLGGTISGADAGISLTTSSDQGMSNITVANAGSGAGDVDSDTTINNDAVTAGTYLKLKTDGASTGAVPLYVSILVDIS